MTAAFDYEDMHHLVDRLTLTQVRRLRLLVTQDEELSQVAQSLPAADTHEAAEDGPGRVARFDRQHQRSGRPGRAA